MQSRDITAVAGLPDEYGDITGLEGDKPLYSSFISGPLHRDDDLRAELGLAALPRSTGASPARAGAFQASSLRQMWLHESDKSEELRKMLEKAAVTSNTYLGLLSAGIQVRGCL